jgi:hypothetical protein
LSALCEVANAQQRYYQVPRTGSGAPWVIRDDLPPMPDNNDDPVIVKSRELINEGASDQKYLAFGSTFNYISDAYGSGSIIASFILPFQRKATPNINLLFENYFPVFHCLNQSGGPIWIGAASCYPNRPGYEGFARIWNTGHFTLNNSASH